MVFRAETFFVVLVGCGVRGSQWIYSYTDSNWKRGVKKMCEIEVGDIVRLSKYGKSMKITFPNRVEIAGVSRIKKVEGLIRLEFYPKKGGAQYHQWYAKEFLEKVKE